MAKSHTDRITTRGNLNCICREDTCRVEITPSAKYGSTPCIAMVTSNYNNTVIYPIPGIYLGRVCDGASAKYKDMYLRRIVERTDINSWVTLKYYLVGFRLGSSTYTDIFRLPIEDGFIRRSHANTYNTVVLDSMLFIVAENLIVNVYKIGDLASGNYKPINVIHTKSDIRGIYPFIPAVFRTDNVDLPDYNNCGVIIEVTHMTQNVYVNIDTNTGGVNCHKHVTKGTTPFRKGNHNPWWHTPDKLTHRADLFYYDYENDYGCRILEIPHGCRLLLRKFGPESVPDFRENPWGGPNVSVTVPDNVIILTTDK